MIPLVAENDDGIRPAGPQDECFYCQQKVGTPHHETCVCLERKIRVRYIFDIEIEVPWSWDENMIEFHRNDGSWCADNAIHELERAAEDRCLCNRFHCTVLEIPEAEPYRKLRDQGDDNE